MATANLGRVGFVNKGTYSGATAYKVNDVVTYNTGTYACIQANTGQAPTNTSYWQNWASDNAVHKTGDETKTGTMTFMDNVGIGVTPSAWIGFKCAEFTRGCYIGNYSSTPDLFLGSNSYFDGVNWVYKGNGYATRYQGNGYDGAHYWHTASSGTAGNQITFKTVMTIDNSGNVLVTGSGGLGYGTGSGGTVTQLTSKSTTVTLNKPSGTIIMNNASLAAGALVTFGFYNSNKGATDNMLVSIFAGIANEQAYNCWVIPTATIGFSYIVLKNISGGSLSESVYIKFDVIKGAIS